MFFFFPAAYLNLTLDKRLVAGIILRLEENCRISKEKKPNVLTHRRLGCFCSEMRLRGAGEFQITSLI